MTRLGNTSSHWIFRLLIDLSVYMSVPTFVEKPAVAAPFRGLQTRNPLNGARLAAEENVSDT
jgi:hypothetical protein